MNHWVTGMGSTDNITASTATFDLSPMAPSVCQVAGRQVRSPVHSVGQWACGLAAKKASGQRASGLERELVGVSAHGHLVAAPGDAPLSGHGVESG